MLDKIFPDGIYVPEMFIGRQVLHLPTLKTHGHSITTGAIKNSFGGLLQEAAGIIAINTSTRSGPTWMILQQEIDARDLRRDGRRRWPETGRGRGP